jgi:hypothetical protein
VAEQLAESECELERTRQLLEEVIGESPRRDRKVQAVLDLQANSPTIPDRHRSDAWGAYNALTEWLDHGRPQPRTARRVEGRLRAALWSDGRIRDRFVEAALAR